MIENLISRNPNMLSSPVLELGQLHPLRMEISVLGLPEQLSQVQLNNLVGRYVKTGKDLSEEFVLKGFLGKKQQNITESGDGLFQTDGQYSFALGYLRGRAKKPLWIAIASLATGEVSSNYRNTLVENGIETSYECEEPLIVQLQGPAYWSYDNRAKFKDAREVLDKIRWEKALVELCLNWAKQNGIPAVYLLPSDSNQYLPTDWRQYERLIELKRRFNVRYDVTARRMGFTKEGQGFYKKALS